MRLTLLGLTSIFMPKLKKFAVPTIIAASIALLLAQCSVGNLLPAIVGKKIWLSDDESTLKQEVRRRIPVGSSISDAKFSLQLNGFECSYQKDSDSGASIETKRTTSKEADYLYCDAESHRLICIRTYTSFVRYKNETVTNVDAAIGGWCL